MTKQVCENTIDFLNGGLRITVPHVFVTQAPCFPSKILCIKTTTSGFRNQCNVLFHHMRSLSVTMATKLLLNKLLMCTGHCNYFHYDIFLVSFSNFDEETDNSLVIKYRLPQNRSLYILSWLLLSASTQAKPGINRGKHVVSCGFVLSYL